MVRGVQQLFQHVTLWSQVPVGLTAVSPIDAASLAASSRAAVESLNRYVMEMRLQEIGLQKALNINPDALQSHAGKGDFSEYFLYLSPRPAWMDAHPNVASTLDDLQQFRNALVGAKRRLNHWSRHSRDGRPVGLSEHLQWLQELTHTRSQLARLAVQLGEPGAGIALFYDAAARQRGRILGIEESLAHYFRVRRPVRSPR